MKRAVLYLRVSTMDQTTANQDITDLRRTELALREAVAKLERERENKLMNVEAIMASIAHEVRQPLDATGKRDVVAD
jgi:signal transduction histidine kinase